MLLVLQASIPSFACKDDPNNFVRGNFEIISVKSAKSRCAMTPEGASLLDDSVFIDFPGCIITLKGASKQPKDAKLNKGDFARTAKLYSKGSACKFKPGTQKVLKFKEICGDQESVTTCNTVPKVELVDPKGNDAYENASALLLGYYMD